MTDVFGRAGVDHVDSGLVVFGKDDRASLRKSKVEKDGTKLLVDFGGIDSSDKFGFSGAGGKNCRLDLGLVNNGSTGKTEAETGDRGASTGASGVGGINKANEFAERQKASGGTR